VHTLLKRGAQIGAGAGILAVVIVIALAFLSPEPPGGSGERLMGLSLLLTRIGQPLTLGVAALAYTIGTKSALFSLVYVLVLAAVLFEWALGGMIIAWFVGLAQQSFGRPRS
jgi:hypothetical protein